jgi:ribosome-associated toxin RatA of RatAB toxin-antitoxin module
LVVFAGLLLALLSQPRHLRMGARLVIAADVAWVSAATAILAAQPFALTSFGRIALAGVTVAVAAIAATQLMGLRRAGAGPLDGASPFSIQTRRDLVAPVAAVWDAVSDAAGYARFVPGIATTVVSGDGDDMVRVCTDDHGSQWSERCTLWEPGRRYRMSVDVSSYPLRYRMLFAELHQTWNVEPATQGTRVTLTFHGAVKLGVLGRLALRMLGRARRLDKILDAYEAELATQPQPL